MAEKKSLILRRQQIEDNMQTFSHPWNPKSEISGTQMGRALGLKRTGVNFVKVPPGKESFVYHSHYREEEWIYILSGSGIAEIDGEEFEVGAGDFMAFPTPSVAHHLRNAGEEDLVYLAGGENLDIEIADFPRLGKRMFRREDAIEIFDLEDAKPFGSLDTE
ncbi:cupin domain-containing protein [Coleofasciculus sp. FACHB-712]|uniref:cupin domain-containing protein n=1 Tax=unclassified Coleofasciculus TaxID=2692782 RepID=UPI0016834BAF|nr:MULTISPECIES: cupin domain-containing protein [unclassified Coleofasciculus]MBD1942450.1 cupin domain-containing protein [Coleofasciculus sp. FACHB-712]MBD2085552.1 cupin domain-containing protein [Coleofasciculus sp. FACHB-542]